MYVTIANIKGGVAKSTTAIHLAAYLQQLGTTLLIDGDSNRSASMWAEAGRLPFKVITEKQAARHIQQHGGDYKHFVHDTAAGIARSGLEDAAACDLLIIPTAPDGLALNATLQTVNTLREIGTKHFKVLLCIVPPNSPEAVQAREALAAAGIPVFRGEIKRRIAYQRAAIIGAVVNESGERLADECWQDYQAIGKEITGK